MSLELKILELGNLDEIPDMIKNDIKNDDKNTALLKFLRIPEFADLMRTDNKSVPKTYNANTASQHSPVKHKGKILSESAPILEKPVHSSSTKVTQIFNQNVNPTVTNRVV